MNFRIAFDSLFDAPSRNLMALAGLALGVATIIAMLTLTILVRREAMDRFSKSGLDVLLIRQTGSSASAGTRRAPGLTLDSLARLQESVPAVEVVAPLTEQQTGVTIDGRAFTASVLGITEAFFGLNALPVATGRGLSDLDQFQPFAVIGREQAVALADGKKPESLVGREILIADRVVTVIGVLADSETISLHEGDVNKTILVPVTTSLRMFDGAAIEIVYARTATGASAAEVSRDITAFFERRAEGLGIQITSARRVVAEMENQLRLFALLLGATGALAFLLGGAAMVNLLLLKVSDRRREIGLRRAMGAMRSDIHAQFLCEALLLCAVGGLIGVVAGVGLTAAIAWYAGWGLVVSPLVLLVGFVAALVIGLVAGSVPAWQAARMDPADAMKAPG